jgi:glyoxylase-like metal-dependent hydrolase (beta-lactamase superfamily II)
METQSHSIVPGQIVSLSPLVRRITASNGGIMTGPGTNTYLLGWREVIVIDPGPLDLLHLENIIQAVESGGGSIHSIWVTHTHRDHSPAAAVLSARTGAPCYGAQLPDDGYQDTSFEPSVELFEGLEVTIAEVTLKALHTPGHVDNHYCFFLEQEGLMFVGDHMMEGTTVVIIPPHGVMAHYIQSLQKLTGFPMQAIAPGHGHIIEQPIEVVQKTIKHRLARERLVLKKLQQSWQTLDELTRAVYKGLDSRLFRVARLSLQAHLIKLESENCAESDGAEQWRKK